MVNMSCNRVLQGQVMMAPAVNGVTCPPNQAQGESSQTKRDSLLVAQVCVLAMWICGLERVRPLLLLLCEDTTVLPRYYYALVITDQGPVVQVGSRARCSGWLFEWLRPGRCQVALLWLISMLLRCSASSCILWFPHPRLAQTPASPCLGRHTVDMKY
jgi:hypothetical protein